MKKWILVIMVGLFLLSICACGGGKYADVRGVLEKQVAATENYLNACDNLKSADDLVVALNGYADALKVLVPAMKALESKYPELKNQEEPPAELKDVMKKLEEVMARFGSSIRKINAYASDPKVQEAQKKFMEIAQGM